MLYTQSRRACCLCFVRHATLLRVIPWLQLTEGHVRLGRLDAIGLGCRDRQRNAFEGQTEFAQIGESWSPCISSILRRL